MKRLIDILACPDCRSPLVRQGDQLVCGLGGHIFPLVNGVPILFPGGKFKDIQHEDPLTIWPDYSRWVHRNLLRSLPDETIVVDLGSSNIAIDDPCIIRVDVKLTPFVDVVADAHALPFREESLDFIMSMAVLEHLHNPFQAGEEMFRVLKRERYVYADTNFVFTYHGYPHHYFNSTIHGLDQVFSLFTKIRSGVPPHQMPSYALENLLSVYLHHFSPANNQEIAFMHKI